MPTDSSLHAVVLFVVLGAVLLLGIVALFLRMRVKVPSGFALIVHGNRREARVTFADALVPPLVARAELVDCSLRSMNVSCEGGDSLRCRDNLRIDVRAELTVGVNHTAEDVLKAAQKVGAARVNDPATLTQLFQAKFIEAIATVIRELDFEDVTRERTRLRDQIIMVIGADLDGWVLRDVAFTRLEQLPLEELDPSNVLDADAIRRITERTSADLLRKHELEHQTRLAILSQNLAAEQAALKLQRDATV